MEMEAYRKNTAAQYEALGRFVEAFELMVSEARSCCINMLSYGLPGERINRIAIPFYHQSFTAKPIFDVFRAVLVELVADPTYQTDHGLTKSDIEQFSGILGAIEKEYQALLERRNSLLHATWFVGYSSHDDPDAETFMVRKYKTSGSGLVRVELPKTAFELDGLRIRCEETRNWISVVHGCLPTSNPDLTIGKCFTKNGKTWERIWPTLHRFPKSS